MCVSIKLIPVTYTQRTGVKILKIYHLYTFGFTCSCYMHLSKTQNIINDINSVVLYNKSRNTKYLLGYKHFWYFSNAIKRYHRKTLYILYKYIYLYSMLQGIKQIFDYFFLKLLTSQKIYLQILQQPFKLKFKVILTFMKIFNIFNNKVLCRKILNKNLRKMSNIWHISFNILHKIWKVNVLNNNMCTLCTLYRVQNTINYTDYLMAINFYV